MKPFFMAYTILNKCMKLVSMNHLVFLKFIVCFILSIITLKTQANEFWDKDYSEVDKFAVTIKYKGNVKILSADLTSSFPDTIDKYRAIFRWVAKNIKYDLKALKKPELRKTKPEEVIKSKKAVCAGYANLFYQLCIESGLNCEVVNGWAKTVISQIGKPLSATTNHAWNVIKISDTYYLCDVTWSAGQTKANNSTYIHKFSGVYFCTPENLFHYKHFPKDSKWLLNTPVTKQEFINFPLLWRFPVDHNISELNPGNGIIKYGNNKDIQISFHLDTIISRVTISSDLIHFQELTNYVYQDGTIQIKYRPKSYSKYLYLYINSTGFMGFVFRK
jgi:hypothetical protein